jgi:transposase
MHCFFLGGDVSKGYADLGFLDDANRTLPGSACYDDTPAGHAAVRARCLQLLDTHPEATLLIGLEASGGLERNWLRTFRDLLPPGRGHVYRLNPLAVKRYLERDLHRNITDVRSARGIAEYLREGLRPADRPFASELEGPRAFYRFLRNSMDRGTQLQNELHSLLPCVHPDLVAFCRDGFPAWVLHLLRRYPTADALKRARPATLARIPYVTLTRASALIQAAKQSVAALRDPYHGEVIRRLATEILRHQTEIAAGKQKLLGSLKHDPEVQLCASQPGIGLWTAVVLRLECGSLTRFHSAAALTAFAGLNPRRHESGDTQKPGSISRRGRKQIRAALYMAALTAIRCNPVIRAFYERLTRQGKKHLVALTACMAKMLRIAYACVLAGQRFDAEQHREIAERHQRQAKERAAERTAEPRAPAPAEERPTGSLAAPVSRREAKRRRAATMPQAGDPRRERGPGAALAPHDTRGANEAPKSPMQRSNPG